MSLKNNIDWFQLLIIVVFVGLLVAMAIPAFQKVRQDTLAQANQKTQIVNYPIITIQGRTYWLVPCDQTPPWAK
jgi:uncharacterized alpha/beta hydrolase family protein